MFSACVVTLMTAHLPHRISPVNESSHQLSENALCPSGSSVDLGLMLSREDVDVVLSRHVGGLSCSG